MWFILAPKPEAAPPPQVQPYRRIPAQPNTTYVIDMPQTMLNPERPRSSSQVCIAVTPSAPQLPECVPRPPVSIPRPTVAPAPRPPVPEPSNVRQSTSTSQITVNPIVDPNMDPPSYDEVMGNANAYEMQSPYNPSYRT